MSGERGHALGVLLAWITSIAVFLLVFEGGLRLLSVPMAAPVVTINEPHPTLGWAKRKNESTHKETSEYDVTFAINSLGLRDDEGLPLKKPAGHQRVLVLGDSFVLGYTVDRSDLFVDLIEKAYQTDGHKIDVINGGTEGFATDQEAVWLREEGLQFEPDVVVLCFYQNDVYWCGQPNYTSLTKPRFPPNGDGLSFEPPGKVNAAEASWLARHTALGGFFHTLVLGSRYGRELVFSRGSVDMPREEAVVLRTPEPSLDIPGCWARLKTALVACQSDCLKHNAKLLFVAIPSREQVQEKSRKDYLARYQLTEQEYSADLPAQTALALATELKIPTLDPLADFHKAAQSGDELYFQKDWHVNPAGNRVLARSIYERLCRPEFLSVAASDVGVRAIETHPKNSAVPRWMLIVGVVWILLSLLYAKSYRDENGFLAALKIAAMISAVVLIIYAFGAIVRILPPTWGRWIAMGVVLGLLLFIVVKSRSRIGIIREVYGSFVRQGLWYMIPLLVAMLTIGSLLIVASSSPFVAPFIYTLF